MPGGSTEFIGRRIDFDSLYKAVRQPGVLTANYGPDGSGIITLLVGKTAICNN